MHLRKHTAKVLVCLTAAVVLTIIAFTARLSGPGKLELQLRNAIAARDYSAVQALLARGANVNHFYYPFDNDQTWTPLHLAASGGDCEMIHLLLKYGADPSIEDGRGEVPIMTFLTMCDDSQLYGDSLRLLLDVTSEVNIVDRNGRSILHLAARYGSAEAVQQVLNRGANVDAVDALGESPLRYSVDTSNDRIQKIEILLRAGADPNSKAKDGRSPRQVVDESSDEEVRRLLAPVP